MADILRGFTFIDGETGDAAELHELVDAATILPAFISAKVSAAPGANDSFVFYQSGSSSLKRCTLTQLIAGFPRGGAASVFALRQLGTGAQQAAAGNDARFPTHITGIRKGNGASADTAATPKDYGFVPKALGGITQVNWDDADLFWDSLTGNKTYTFANARSGRVIVIAVQHNGHSVTWPTITGGSVTPTNTTGIKIYTFSQVGGWLLGSVYG